MVCSKLRNTWLPLALAFGLALGCGSGKPDPNPWDDIFEFEDGFSEVEEGAIQVTFVTPATTPDPVVKGTLDVTVDVQDPEGQPLAVTFRLLKTDIPAEQRDVPGGGRISVALDTNLLKDGKKRLLEVRAVSQDGREGVGTLSMTVDNNPPSIVAEEPTPPEGGNFMGELVVRFTVKDPGTGVTRIVIRSEEFQYLWPADGSTQAKTTVETGEIVIPTRNWTSGDKKVTVEAYDGIADRFSTSVLSFGYIRSPLFLEGDRRQLPDGFIGNKVTGIPLGLAGEGGWIVAAAGASGAATFTRSAQSGRFVRKSELLKESMTGIAAADLNRDGLLDLVAWGPGKDAGTGRILYFLQTVGGMFTPPVQLDAGSNILDVALGDLNDDGLPDFAMALESDIASLGVALSVDDDADPVWGQISVFGGVVRPTLVAVGDFAGNSRNAIVLTNQDSGILTVFPTTAQGIPTGGLNHLIEAKGIRALATTRSEPSLLLPDRLYVSSTEAQAVIMARAVISIGGQVSLNVIDIFPTALTPAAISIGDVDSDGIPDLQVLCKGSNLVQAFFGTVKTAEKSLTGGEALGLGSGRSLTLADLDGDGFGDIVVLDDGGSTITWFRYDPDQKRFDGAPMAILDGAPTAIAAGRFTRPLPPPLDTLRDLAVLVQDKLGKWIVDVLVADSTARVPLVKTIFPVEVTVPNPRGLLSANLDPGAAPNVGLDDLVIGSNHQPNPNAREDTLQVVLFRTGSTHESVVRDLKGFDGGDSPVLFTVADLDRVVRRPDGSIQIGGYTVKDVAAVTSFIEDSEKVTRIQPYLGQADGTFLSADGLGPIVDDTRIPRQILAFPLRWPLYESLRDRAHVDMDLIVVNGATNDLTVFSSSGRANYRTSKDFAVGNSPKGVAVGFLDDRIAYPVAADQLPEEQRLRLQEALPDVVTLLANDVVISYSIDNGSRASKFANELSFSPPVSLRHKGLQPVAVAVADMNGDNYLDIIVLNQGDDTVSIYVNLANRVFSTPFIFPTGAGPTHLLVVDLDGDGCPDIATADAQGRTITFLRNLIDCQAQ